MEQIFPNRKKWWIGRVCSIRTTSMWMLKLNQRETLETWQLSDGMENPSIPFHPEEKEECLWSYSTISERIFLYHLIFAQRRFWFFDQMEIAPCFMKGVSTVTGGVFQTFSLYVLALSHTSLSQLNILLSYWLSHLFLWWESNVSWTISCPFVSKDSLMKCRLPWHNCIIITVAGCLQGYCSASTWRPFSVEKKGTNPHSDVLGLWVEPCQFDFCRSYS